MSSVVNISSLSFSIYNLKYEHIINKCMQLLVTIILLCLCITLVITLVLQAHYTKQSP